MGTTTSRIRGPMVATALVLALAACGGGDGGETAAPPGPAPELRPYCDTVARVQAQPPAPEANGGGVAAAATAARQQVAEVVAVAPPDIALEWRAVQDYTEQSLASLEATGGDASRIDRPALQRLQEQAAPAVDRIRSFTEQGCGITFQVPG